MEGFGEAQGGGMQWGERQEGGQQGGRTPL